MSRSGRRRYRFATPAQWSAGLLGRARLDSTGTVSGYAPWGAPEVLDRGAARAVALSPEAVAYWIDASGQLAVAEADETQGTTQPAAGALVRAARIVVGATQLWAAGSGPRLTGFLRQGLAPHLELDLPGESIIDLAADGRDGVWLLLRQSASATLVHVDCAGHVLVSLHLPPALGVPLGLACLRSGRHIVLLSACASALLWFDPDKAVVTLQITLRTARPGALGRALGSDAQERLVLAGVDAAPFGAGAWVLAFDPEGEAIDSLDLPDPALDVACRDGILLVGSGGGVTRYGAASALGAAQRGEASHFFLSPALRSPPAEGIAPWLRVEADVLLPGDAAVEISVAGSNDPDTVQRMREALADPALTPSTRRQHARALLDWQPALRFTRAAGDPVDRSTLCALPLHDLRTEWLWVEVAVTLPPGNAAARLHSVEVLYPDDSLMQYLPALYRRQADAPGDFLHTLVAALDVSVRDLDAHIASIGAKLDAEEADASWLDAVARWLDLPWDDALDITSKRRLLAAAARLQEQRGTRAGLLALLACVLPPERSRVLDLTVEPGFARLPCANEDGLRLPAVLAGLPRDAAVLGRKACVGALRLVCANAPPPDATAGLAGIVVVEVSATPAERTAWSAWLPALVATMIPLTARLRLRWIESSAATGTVLPRPLQAGGFTLGQPMPPRLGEGATLGRSRLAARAGPALGPTGTDSAFRLH